jgi:2-polyprenyl-3-methyl-5-hydroxy-6-metoxy-1,4-benzoquinol methylase
VYQPVGNYYDKYGTKNPIERFLVQRFNDTVVRNAVAARPTRLLDIGCGEGHLTTRLAEELPSAFVVGADVEPGFLRQVTRHRVPRLVVNVLPATCFQPGSFDLVVMTEVLEHLDGPVEALRAVGALSSRELLITVPHEPWWRMSNMLRLKYVSALGNTPGHVQHFSPGSLGRLLRSQFSSVQIASCFPWLVARCQK